MFQTTNQIGFWEHLQEPAYLMVDTMVCDVDFPNKTNLMRMGFHKIWVYEPPVWR